MRRITGGGARWEYGGISAAQWAQDHALIVATLCVIAWVVVVIAIATSFTSLY
jgi:hypothetical protein